MQQYKELLRLLFCLAVRVCLSFLRPFLPIRKNRVLFVSFRGKQYSCNPRAVSEALQEMAQGRLEIGWAFHSPEKFRFLEEKGVRVLGDKTLEFLVFALTAKVVCTNAYYKPFLPRRRGQFYLRTWHGGGAYKRVGRLEKMPLLHRMMVSLQQDGASLYLSSSRAFTTLTLRDAFGYTGEVLEKGMPRNDRLFRPAPESVRRQVYEAVGLPENVNLALYAPTFRADDRSTAHALDFTRVEKALETRFGGKWRVAFRGHHVVSGAKSDASAPDLTDYMDMQELLSVCRVLITDYSSSIWDMSVARKPALLYCTDLTQYSADRDFFTDIRSWPFPLAENNDELEKNILGFDDDAYQKAVDRHHADLGSYETGRASILAAERIMKECGIM